MRQLLTEGEWKKLRNALLERQGVVCAICGKVETGPRRVYAHEEWVYDESTEPATAIISDVSLVCWHCHACEHWGVTNRLVTESTLTSRALVDTINHFCRINQATTEQFHAHVQEATEHWERRCERAWQIDYGVFECWAATTFKNDPLNDRDWPDAIMVRWKDSDQPTMSEIVANKDCG